MTFTHLRTVYLGDTDAAGVVYFARGMEMCHEAYESWLVSIGISLKKLLQEKKIALPIVHGEIDFFRPISCGDRLQISLQPSLINQTSYAIAYEVFLLTSPDRPVIKAITNHVCINPLTRTRISLPLKIVELL